MTPVSNNVYIFNGRSSGLRHIVRYASIGDNGQISDEYFQDYNYSISNNVYHLAHFIKQKSSDLDKYDVYLDSDLSPTGSLLQDLSTVTRWVLQCLVLLIMVVLHLF